MAKVYLSPIIDFDSREVLAYNVSLNPNYRQIKMMLKDLVKKHGDKIKGAILTLIKDGNINLKDIEKN